MGLDMYLQRRKDIEQEAFSDAHDDKLSGVIYWRKANAIHKYFIHYGALESDGTPDVGYYIITKENLLNLIERITSILNGQKHKETDTYFDVAEMKEVSKEFEYNLDKELASEILPTQSGFFFGSTEYDYWYYKNLSRTLDLVKGELAAVPNNQVWYYYASW